MSLLINPKKENRWRTIAEKRPDPGRLCSTCWNISDIKNPKIDLENVYITDVDGNRKPGDIDVYIVAGSKLWHKNGYETRTEVEDTDGWKYSK